MAGKNHAMKKPRGLRRNKRAEAPQATAIRPRGKRDVGKLFDALVALQARLRAPNGCPWDREQNHDTLRPYLVEETYEVLDALDSNDPAHIAEELGDLLLQVVFHAQLGAEAKRFDIADVIEHIHTKLVRRHPHVFGTVKADTAAQVLKKWEELKAEERAEKKVTIRRGLSSRGASRRGTSPLESSTSVLDAVPRNLPALLEAHQLSRRAANVGFDWRDVGGILEKLNEEAGELRKELEAKRTRDPSTASSKNADSAQDDNPAGLSDRSRIEDEVGDLLFVCVNLARFLKLDAEIALKKSNLKFARRFRQMERTAAERGRQLSQLSAGELENLWTEAKRFTNAELGLRSGGL